MPEKQIAPYGSWKSPITSDLIVSETIGISQIKLDGKDIYWVEMRPAEGGRNVIVRRTPDGRITDITPSPFNARTRVHEYGGGAFAVAHGKVYFSHFTDQRLYYQEQGGKPLPVTPEEDLRYADGLIDLYRGRMICICEDHRDDRKEATNTLVSIGLESPNDVKGLVSGNDFYSSPRLSADGTRLAWLTWNHPNMPWDGTELWISELHTDGSLIGTKKVAGGVEESIFQPEWSPDGILYFVSDRSGWWNLYRWRGHIEPVIEMQAEFGLPQWIFGMTTYAFESAHRIMCSYTRQGRWHLAGFDVTPGKLEVIENPYTEIGFLGARPGSAVFIGGSPVEPRSVVRLDLATRKMEVLRRSTNVTIDPGYLSVPEAIQFPTEQGMSAHALFYPPENKDYTGPLNKRPPLLVISHGGPTAATSSTLNLAIQYWASRGIAVMDVNYGGSSGYGREYRQRLEGKWGIVDVDDCINGARFLVKRGSVDGDKLAIRGSSAGGYTTLSAITFRKTFRAGASYYGVSDLEALRKETHKFESRYLDRLIGPYPERQDFYRGRSPIHFLERLSCPVIFFQGLEDKIVPPDQAEMMVEALRDKGLPVAYVPFEGEQHGFRRAENIKRSLDAELYFYSRVFGFSLPEPVKPVSIENL